MPSEDGWVDTGFSHYGRDAVRGVIELELDRFPLGVEQFYFLGGLPAMADRAPVQVMHF